MSGKFEASTSRRATFLFTVPSFMQGVAQVFDISGGGVVCYNTSKDADFRALYQDWAAVGDDLVFGARSLTSL